ncbi:zinc finger MYM-type protein 1-like [Gymnodraco acuticeps]|uniref:Zinc finger MYM-type protein 1-like n=1 Tax=Gymnodraco acuticeps TaxID=8218 RepID=A0A6P8VKB4_GYMAC|nr:zinc finger MYM-type protein 1-like [Gymnodraco acuticeps]
MADVSDSDDIVAKLLTESFSRMSYTDKLELITKGRPTPQLNLVQKPKRFERHFNIGNYARYNWMTGSTREHKLYCWDCLLFGADSGSWARDGYSDLGSLSKSAHRHQNASGHLRATIRLKTFGDTRIELQLDEQQRRGVILHNEKVKRNRGILKRLINCVVYLGKQELPFRGHDESVTSSNKGNYIELLDLVAEYDSDLHTHLATSTVFTGTSSRIQNDLISAVASVMTDSMKEELRKAPFVAVMLDETTDISNVAQMSYVLRYVTDDGIKERFFKYEDVTEDKRAEAIATRLLEFLRESGCIDKVVAQCYDGAAVMASGLNGVQAKVKETIPQALFIHCYAHILNLDLSKGASKIRECKVFFSHLSGLATFFSRSAKRTKLLDDICQHRLPRAAPTRWCFHSRLVCTVADKTRELREVFEHIVDHHTEFDDETVHCSDGYITLLTSFDFSFWLKTFHAIFSYSDVVFEILQNKGFDMQFCLARVDQLQRQIEQEKGNFDSVYDETQALVGPPRGRGAQGDVRARYRELHCSVIDSLLTQISNRFSDHKKLEFLALLDPQQFGHYCNYFPTAALNSLMESYGGYFDQPRLHTELAVMYGMSDILGKSPADIHQFLLKKGLSESMKQVYTLSCIILTIPVSTASVERSFSALKRIKSYSRSTTGQVRLSDLALISIEKELLIALKAKDQLHDDAIKFFIQKDRRMDFVFR